MIMVKREQDRIRRGVKLCLLTCIVLGAVKKPRTANATYQAKRNIRSELHISFICLFNINIV